MLSYLRENIRPSAKTAMDAIVQLLWPGLCGICRRQISHEDNGLCPECWQSLLEATAIPYCNRCGANATPYMIHNGRCPNCAQAEFEFDGIIRSGVYQGSIAGLIVALKHDRTELCRYVSMLANATLSASRYNGDIEMFVPVPLHWRRRISRGYNQSLLIAKQTCRERARISLDLARIRNTARQPSFVDYRKRYANVKDAFAVRSGHCFEEKSVCLVDDVMTTGATLNECARVLKQAGAKRVYAFVIAVAGQKADT